MLCLWKVRSPISSVPGQKERETTTSSNNKKSDNPQDTHLLEGGEEAMGREQGVGAYSLFTLGSKRPSPYKVQLSVGGQALEMEVDTEASLSVIQKPCLRKQGTPIGEIRNCPSYIN